MWWIFILGSAVLGAIADIIRKKVLVKEHALEFGAARSMVNLAVLLIALFFFRPVVSIEQLFFFAALGLILMASILLTSKSMRHMELSLVAPLANFSPAFLLVFAFFFLDERITQLQYSGIFLLLLGGYVLQASKDKKGFWQPIKQFWMSKYLHFLIFAMVGFSITATMEKYSLSVLNVEPLHSLYWIVFFSGVYFIIMESFQHGIKEIFRDLREDRGELIATSLLSLMSAVFYMIGLVGAPVSLVIPFKRIGTLITTLLGGRLFHEHNLMQKMLACLVMVCGAVLVAL